MKHAQIVTQLNALFTSQVKLLIAAGADPEAKDRRGKSVADYAKNAVVRIALDEARDAESKR